MSNASSICFSKEYHNMAKINLTTTPKSEANNMKELNLAEILSGYEDETFYCPILGDVIIWDIESNGYRIVSKERITKGLNISYKGKANDDESVILFPSLTLYKKYPLDPYSAWMEWESEKKPKQWRSVEDELPGTDDDVLVIFTRSYTPTYIEKAVAYYDGEDWYTQDGSHIRPTHWMPIPEPPKDESE